MHDRSGFSLVELIVVIVVVSVGLVGLARMFGNTSTALVTGEETVLLNRYAQECAETVLGGRRDLGFDIDPRVLTKSGCSTTPAAGYVRTFGLGTVYAGAATGPCPSGATCRNITVTVSKGALSSSIAFMLVQ